MSARRTPMAVAHASGRHAVVPRPGCAACRAEGRVDDAPARVATWAEVVAAAERQTQQAGA